MAVIYLLPLPTAYLSFFIRTPSLNFTTNSLYGLASASMLYGAFDCPFKETWEQDVIASAKDSFHQATSTLQMAFGVRWDAYVHRDRYHIGLYAGWEQNIWFGLNKMNRYFSQLSQGELQQLNGDLSLQGATGGVRFDF